MDILVSAAGSLISPAKYYFEDVGVVEAYGKDQDGKTMKKRLEVDFVANQGSRRYYLQSAYEMNRTEKEEQGIVTMGIREFLLDPNSLES